MGSLILQTGPTVEPVTLAELRAHLRIIDNADNSYLTDAIPSARRVVERFLDRALNTQTWLMVRDTSPGKELWLPFSPLQSVTSINVHDWDDVATLVGTASYLVITDTEPGRILLKDGSTWPTHRNASSFKVVFVVGYGDAASDVPPSIKHGIKLLATKIYEHRGDEVGLTDDAAEQLLLNDVQLRNFLHTDKQVGI